MRISNWPTAFGLQHTQSIRSRIVTLVLIIVVPLVCLFLWVAVRYAAAKTELIELQRFDATSRISMTIDREIAGSIGMLTGLAGADDLANRNYLDFSKHALVLISTHKIARIWAFTREGSALPLTLTPAGTGGAATLEPEAIARLFNGSPVVLPLQDDGGADTTAIVAVPVPVRDGSAVAYAVGGAVRVLDLSRVVSETGMETQWVAAVVDSNGRFVARSLDAGRWIGQLARPELGVAAKQPNQTGIFDNVTHEGVAMRNSYHRSSLTGWTTVVAVPSSELSAPLRRAVVLVLLGGITMILATLAAASLFAARISGPVRELSQYAHALANGTSYPAARDNIKELDEVRSALESATAGSARLAAIVASSGDAIISFDLDGTITTWNKGAEDLFGYTATEIIGRPKTVVLPGDRIAEFEAQKLLVLAGQSIRTETMRRKRDGTIFHVSIDAAPIRHPDGTIIAISSIIHDITERQVAEEHKLFLMRELAHRSKNQLAIIQSIANQTSRRANTLPEFLAAFGQRIQGLAASHDLLISGGWHTVGLTELIERQLSVFTDIEGSSITATGPPVRLDASHAEAIGLALHELATNSTKYGALSVPAGKVSINWQVRPNGSGSALDLDWKESGGPQVVPPATKGFGSQVIENMVARSVGGEATIHYLPDGIVWHLNCNLK
jgi:PAS domain S-box-containing protein